MDMKMFKITPMTKGEFLKKHPGGMLFPTDAKPDAKGYSINKKDAKPPFIWASTEAHNRALKNIKEMEMLEKSEIAKSKKDFNKLMTDASAKQWKGLVEFINAANNSAYSYRYHAAELNGRWGEVSFFEKFRIGGGSEYKMMSKRTKAYMAIEKAVKETRAITGERDRHLGLHGVAKVDNGDHYVAFISGGNNGRSDWVAYLESLSRLVKSQKRAWLIEMNQHSDVYYVLMGFVL